MKKIKQLKNKLVLTAAYIVVLLIFWLLKLPCLYKYFFNIDCIGCGMSRAYFSLLRLDIADAFSYHPMFWSVPIAYLYLLFDGKLLGKKYLDITILIAIALGFIVNWVLKIW